MTTETDTALALRFAGAISAQADMAESIESPRFPPPDITIAEARSIASALREYTESQWRPICEAPKNGSRVLLWAGSRVVIGCWSDESHARRPRPLWVTSSGAHGFLGVSWDRDNQPTHWRPLPSPPSEQSG